jgi:hypothetical protein
MAAVAGSVAAAGRSSERVFDVGVRGYTAGSRNAARRRASPNDMSASRSDRLASLRHLAGRVLLVGGAAIAILLLAPAAAHAFETQTDDVVAATDDDAGAHAPDVVGGGTVGDAVDDVGDSVDDTGGAGGDAGGAGGDVVGDVVDTGGDAVDDQYDAGGAGGDAGGDDVDAVEDPSGVVDDIVDDPSDAVTDIVDDVDDDVLAEPSVDVVPPLDPLEPALETPTEAGTTAAGGGAEVTGLAEPAVGPLFDTVLQPAVAAAPDGARISDPLTHSASAGPDTGRGAEPLAPPAPPSGAALPPVASALGATSPSVPSHLATLPWVASALLLAGTLWLRLANEQRPADPTIAFAERPG